MSNYVWGSNLSYADYLKAKSFVSDEKSAPQEAGIKVSMDISHQTLNVIASIESLCREHMELLSASTDRTVGTLNDGFERILYNIAGFDQISSGISELNAKFHWGFGDILASVGHMNDPLSELVKIAKTPLEIVAFNHFEIAREAFRQGLYRESLEELDKAISGDYTSPGYKLEWRFHQMKGILQLGFADCDMSLYDLPKAEESFLTAARYGKADYPYDAGCAYLSAGWAAYCQGKMKEALAHTEQAIDLHLEMGEAFFQASKVKMALGDVESALPLLGKSIDLHRFYALKAAGDADFQRHDALLRGYFEALRNEKYRQCEPKVKAALEKIKGFELAPGTENTLQDILSEGANWPLMDVLNVVKNLDSYDHIPIIVRVKAPGQPVNSTETYTEEETYYEDVVIKPAGFFKKAVTEKQKKTRLVTKQMTVTKNLPGSEIHFDFCPILAGTCRMESHEVKNDKDFYLGKYQVTQQQWEGVMGYNPSYFKGENLPVETVSHDDVQIFILKLNSISGKKNYRLPTEAEWEYACRAESTSEYYFGDDVSRLGEYAWYKGNAGGKTHPVGQKKPNKWGLYDMAGNVREWTESWSDRSCLYFVNLGGSWHSDAEYCRSVSRLHNPPVHKSNFVGLRLVFVP